MTAAASYIVDLTEANFADVIGRSRQVPILVDFWAEWCAPCKQIGPVLEKLAREHQGEFILAKVNADREPLITQQFGVRGLPTLKLVVQGQLAGELVGAHPEAAIRKFLAPHIADNPGVQPSPEGDFHAQVLAAVQDGHVEDAIAALSARLREQKDDHKSRALLAEILIQENRLDEAETILAAVPEPVAELRRPRALLAFAGRTKDLPSLESLESAMRGAPNAEIRYRYALRLISGARLEEGLELLLELFRRDRQYGDDAARKAMLEVFEMLGRDDPIAARYRRQLANYLH